MALDFKICPFCGIGKRIEPAKNDFLENQSVIRFDYDCGLIGYFYYKKGHKRQFNSEKCIENKRRKQNAATKTNSSNT